MPAPSRWDDMVGAIAVMVLLIGTASGSAYVMLGMSVTAIILLAAIYRQHLATGAILVGTALDELERTGKKTALITLCIGAGMGTATIIERV